MNLLEFTETLKAVGLSFEVAKTRNPEYERCFIFDPDNVTLGRATIFRGQYKHVKWYVSGCGFYPTRLYLYMLNGGMLTREQYDEAGRISLELATADYNAKKQWRLDNPKPNGGKRQRLTDPKRVGKHWSRALAIAIHGGPK